jgi:hypothetical protein
VFLFNFTASQCARDQRAASLALSPFVSANALGHDQQYECVNSACRNIHREHVTVNGNLATFGGQPATGNVFVRKCGRQGLYVNVGGVLSWSTQSSSTSASPSWTLCVPLPSRRGENVATSDPLVISLCSAKFTSSKYANT